MLNGIPLAMLMRDQSYLHNTNETAPLVSNNKSKMAQAYSQKELMVSGSSKEEVVSCECNAHGENKSNKETGTSSAISPKCGLFLLKDWMFVMFMLSYATTLLSHISLHWFIPNRAVEIGFSSHDAVMTVTVLNFSNIFSRLMFGIMSSEKFFNHVVILTFYVFMSGLTSILSIYLTNYWTYMIFSALFGLLRGLFVIYTLLIIVHLVGKSQVNLALGLIFSLTGLVFIVFIPIFGHFNEVTHSYRTTFILYGSIELIGGLFIVTIPIYLYFKSHKYC